jgi:choline dehydrogenase-like flavoprotein
MIIDSQQAVPDLGNADVCIVGGGAAGIALAVELARTPLKVVLLEQGGLTPTGGARPVYKVLPGRKVTLGVDANLPFFLGGNTNYWYGNCRPLDADDFEPRAWIPNSGWPIRRDDLVPYYERAQVSCGLGGFRWYDVNACRPLLGPQAKPLASSVLETRIVQATPEFSFATLHGQVLADASNVTVVLGTRVVRLRAGGNRIVEAEAVLANGDTALIAADRFVLSAGGIENSRILLASADLMDGAASAVSNLVGRYFQEHFYYTFETELTDPARGRRSRNLHLYNVGIGRHLHALTGHRQGVGDATIWGQLVPSAAVAREQALPGLALWFRPSLFRDAPPELSALKAAIRRPRNLPKAAVGALRHPLRNSGYVWRRLIGREDPSAKLTLVVQVEQIPNSSNAVRLSSAVDGQPGVSLNAELDRDQRATHARALQIAGDELGLNGRQLAAEMERKYLAGDFDFHWHHMGTTRMGDDPRVSVVDPDCKVHGIANLFVAGSSVFPTSGSAGPTLTIVALAIRLADHLAESSAYRQRTSEQIGVAERSLRPSTPNS